MKERHVYMDWLRALAIVVVVGVHTASKILNNSTPDEWVWHYANAIDSALRWCVPVFFMLSGALLLTGRKGESTPLFLKKRVSKVLIPLLFWSAIYLGYNMWELEESYTIKEMFILFLTDNIYYHLWFLYVILGLYLMAPFLKILVDHMSKATFQIFLGFWVVFSVLMPLIPKFLEFEPAFSAGLFEPYIGYFLLGAYLVLYPIPKKWLPALGILAVAGYITTVWGTAALTEARGELDEFFYEHYRPNNVLITLFLFAAFQAFESKLKPNPVITRISMATLGIYVLHPLVQTYLNKWFGINETMFNPLLAVPIVWILIFILSLGIVTGLQRIPYANKVIP